MTCKPGNCLERPPIGTKGQRSGSGLRLHLVALACILAGFILVPSPALAANRRHPLGVGYHCKGRPHPKGTNLVGIVMTKRTPRLVSMEAIFDGRLPPRHPNPSAGDLRVTLTLYFFTGPHNRQPYEVLMSTDTIPQAGRVGHGFIDSSSFVVHIAGADWYLSFNPSVFTQLNVRRPVAFAADVLVERFVSNGSSLGYFQVGSDQVCP